MCITDYPVFLKNHWINREQWPWRIFRVFLPDENILGDGTKSLPPTGDLFPGAHLWPRVWIPHFAPTS